MIGHGVQHFDGIYLRNVKHTWEPIQQALNFCVLLFENKGRDID
jgi:hypothetical protein